MVTNGLQRNVHSAGVLIAVVAQRFSPGEPLASAMRKNKRQGKSLDALHLSYPRVLREIRSSCTSSKVFQPSIVG